MHIGKTGVSMNQKSDYWSFKWIVYHTGILIRRYSVRFVMMRNQWDLPPHTFPVCKLEVLSRLCWLPVMSCNGLKCVCRSEVALHLSEGNQTTFSSLLPPPAPLGHHLQPHADPALFIPLTSNKNFDTFSWTRKERLRNTLIVVCCLLYFCVVDCVDFCLTLKFEIQIIKSL